MVVVAIIDVYSFSLLDQSKLGAFGAVTLAWNVVLSYYLLKEELTRLTLSSVFLIAVGTVMAVSSSGNSTEFKLDQIVRLSHTPQVVVWCVLNGIGLTAGIYYIERAVAAPIRPNNFNALLSILSPVTGGLCMGFTGWGAKAISTCIFDGEWSSFANYPIYGFILLVALALTGQVRYLNKGLEYADAMKVVSVFQAAIICSNSLGGIIFYGDLSDASPGKKAVFGLGIVVAVLGVCLLLGRGSASSGTSHTPLSESEHGMKGRTLSDEELGDDSPKKFSRGGSSGGGGGGGGKNENKRFLEKQPSASSIHITREPASPLLSPSSPEKPPPPVSNIPGGALELKPQASKNWKPWPDAQ